MRVPLILVGQVEVLRGSNCLCTLLSAIIDIPVLVFVLENAGFVFCVANAKALKKLKWLREWLSLGRVQPSVTVVCVELFLGFQVGVAGVPMLVFVHMVRQNLFPMRCHRLMLLLCWASTSIRGCLFESQFLFCI